MTISQTTFLSQVIDAKIHRISALPAQKKGSGTVLVLHGLGDHMGCHEKAIRLFCQQGYRAEGFDWPGNGRSSGKRGDIPGITNAVSLLEEIIGALDEPLTAIYAHSTGAFITLAYWSQSPQNLPLKWIWLSSPLLVPTHRQNKLKLSLARLLGNYAPSLTFPTGVHPSRCYHTNCLKPIEVARQFQNCHSKISARFANDLIHWEPRVARAATKITSPTAVLITQGDEDTICPPNYAYDLYKNIASDQKAYLSLAGFRHEPLREPNNETFLKSVAEWLAANSPAN
jgi:alpha-beta hydrolase superfamily lysophospholipase